MSPNRSELEHSGVAQPIGCPIPATRPMHSSGCLFNEGKPAPAMQYGTTLSSANGNDRSSSAMVQSLMSPRCTLSLGELAHSLGHELTNSSSRVSHSPIINSRAFGVNTIFEWYLPLHQSYFNFPDISFSRSTSRSLLEEQAYSNRQVGSPRDPRIMQQVDHTILTHHLNVTPSQSANYSLDVTSIAICSGVVRNLVYSYSTKTK